MSETAVRVDLRQATLSESAQLREADDSVFLSLDQPPPVRSLLRISDGDRQRAFEVGRVIEVVGDGEPERGCYGAFVELERLEDQVKVGSEHLQPGISGSGVPSPVVIMSTAEMMLGEAGSDEDEAAAAADEAESSSDEGESSDEAEGESSSDEGSSDEGGEGSSDEGDSGDAEGDSGDAEGESA
ncbi:hypothetical protein ENSA5_07060 [Enhygromyxa salina]|uniref:Uncharacterized protein n=1 Tax=Enhygromyxa salina TaxID=215803 RepID=A0A2S9YH84_9BACT|nr:hypothetical protein [Enhygromyxa salina]PRQ04475.1 hypothetical protein ENSA5_07060 [Enhygromyxa salina]